MTHAADDRGPADPERRLEVEAALTDERACDEDPGGDRHDAAEPAHDRQLLEERDRDERDAPERQIPESAHVPTLPGPARSVPYHASRSRRRVAGLHEAERAPPRILAGVLMFGERAVEERVRRAWIRHEVVRDARFLQRTLEPLDVARRDARVVAAEQTQHRRAHPWRAVLRRSAFLALARGETAVETDDAGDLGVLGRGEERLPAAHTEAEDEYAARVGRAAKMPDRARDVRLDRGRLRLGHMLAELEVVTAARGARGAAEVVEGDRVHSSGGKAFGELLIERVQSSDVGRDDDATVALAGLSEMRAESRRVLAREDDLLAGGAAGDREEIGGHIGRTSTGRMTHGTLMLPPEDPVCSLGCLTSKSAWPRRSPRCVHTSNGAAARSISSRSRTASRSFASSSRGPDRAASSPRCS